MASEISFWDRMSQIFEGKAYAYDYPAGEDVTAMSNCTCDVSGNNMFGKKVDNTLADAYDEYRYVIRGVVNSVTSVVSDR